VGRLLTGSAERFPDRAALIYEERSLSFAELDERSNRLAHVLHGDGIAAGDTVALFTKKRPEWVADIFTASPPSSCVASSSTTPASASRKSVEAERRAAVRR